MVVRAEGDAAAADEFTGLKPTSVKDFKNLSNEQILEEVTKSKKMLFQLRMRQSTRKEFKPHHFGILKTKVAQLYTVKREREIAEGVDKRDSREMKFKERAGITGAGVLFLFVSGASLILRDTINLIPH